MITGIYIENFKGIGEPGVYLELKPVTLLFGNNSAGKSTLFHAMLYAYEVMIKGNRNPDATAIGGNSVDLGGFPTFVHRHELSRSIEFRFELDLKSERLDIEHPIPECLVGYNEDVDVGTIGEDVWSAQVAFTVSWDINNSQPYISEYSVRLNDGEVAKLRCERPGSNESWLELNIEHEMFNWPMEAEIDKLGVMDLLYPRLQSEMDRIYCEGYVIGYDEVDDLEEMIIIPGTADLSEGADEIRMVTSTTDDGKDYGALMQRSESGIQVREFLFPYEQGWDSVDEATDQANVCLELWSTHRPSIQVRSQRDALPNWHLPLQLELFDEGSSEFEMTSGDESLFEYDQVFEDLVTRLVVVPGRILARALEESRYIGPLREIPHRSHAAPLSPNFSRWSNGLAAWDLLCGASDEMLASVSSWLASSERLGTGYSLTRKCHKLLDCDSYIMRILQQENPLDDLEMAIEGIRELPKQFRLILRDENSLVEVEPQDIAIGITQLVPVVVAALDRRDGITMIEQPELHNHPAVEVGLGDLFIETILQEHSRFFLETHGEHLILRMLKRIRQTTENELPEGIRGLQPDQIAVYYVERALEGVKVTHMRIDETGEFIDKWPKGFFEERAEELF